MPDDDLGVTPNPALDQHFLSNRGKLARFVAAAGVHPGDRVVEAGAGIGTVAQHVPPCRQLTLIEYDGDLIPRLRRRVPHACVVQGDAVSILPTLRFEVLLSNLPGALTPALVELLPELDFRVALLTVPSMGELTPLAGTFRCELIMALEPDDFRPRQAARAQTVRLTRLLV